MNAINEIEQAIRNLSGDDLAAFRRWFAEFDAGFWDHQFEADVSAGRLDELACEAIDDRRGGRCTDL